MEQIIQMINVIRDILFFNTELSIILLTIFVVILLIYLNYDRIENLFMLLRMIAVVIFLMAIVLLYLVSNNILGISMSFTLSYLSGAIFLLFISFLVNPVK